MRDRRPLIALPTVLFFAANTLLAAPAETSIWKDRQEKLARVHAAAAPPSALFSNLPVARRIPPLQAPTVDIQSSSPGDPLGRLTGALPLTHVTLRQARQGKAGETAVVLIQDVHLNAEAQENIGVALERLGAARSIERVGVEGAFAPLNFSRLDDFSDQKVVRAVAGDFLRAGTMAAPSFAGLALGPRRAVSVIGVDDEAAYGMNVAAYRQATGQQASLKSTVAAFEARLTDLKRRHYGRELADLDGITRSYQKGDTGLAPFLMRLEKAAGGAPETIRLFLEAYSIEQRLDFNRVEAERRRVIEKLAAALSAAELKSLLDQTVAYRSGGVSLSDFHSRLKALCLRKGVDLTQTPSFDAYLRYVLLADRIVGETLLKDLDVMERAAFDRLTRTPEQRALSLWSRRADTLLRLSDFAVGPEEWEQFHASPFTLAEFDSVLGTLDGAVRASGLPDLAPFKEFYRLADLRSQTIVTRLLEGKPASAALVVGGFHTPMIERLLEKRGCPLVVCSPRLTRVDLAAGTVYLTIFSREKTSIEKLFSGERLFINPERVNFGSDPNLERQVAVEAAARVGEGDFGGTLPASITMERRGTLIRVALDGLSIFLGRAARVAGFQQVGARVGGRGFQFVELPTFSSRARRQMAAFGISALSLLSVAATGDVPWTALAVLASTGLAGVGIALLVRAFRRTSEVNRLLRAALDGVMTDVPGAQVWRLRIPGEEGRWRWQSAGNRVRVGERNGSPVLEAREGETVILELEPGQTGFVASMDHTTCTSIQFQAVNPANGRTLIGHAHIVPRAYHMDMVREALALIRDAAAERGYRNVELAINWTPRGAMVTGDRVTEEAAQSDLARAISDAGTDAVRFEVKVVEARQGALSTAVGAASALRSQRPFNSLQERAGVKPMQMETPWGSAATPSERPRDAGLRARLLFALTGAGLALMSVAAVGGDPMTTMIVATLVGMPLLAAWLVRALRQMGTNTGVAANQSARTARFARGAVVGLVAGLLAAALSFPDLWPYIAGASALFVGGMSAGFNKINKGPGLASKPLIAPSMFELPDAASLAAANYWVMSPTFNEGEQLRASVREIWRQGYLSRVIFVSDGSSDVDILRSMKDTGLEGLTPEENAAFRKELSFVAFDVNQRKEGAIRSALAFLSGQYETLPAVTLIQDSDSHLLGDDVAAGLQRGARSMIDNNFAAMGIPIEGNVTRASGVVAWGEAITWRLSDLGKRAHELLERVVPGMGGVVQRSVPGGVGFFRTAQLRSALEQHSGRFEAGDLELANLIIKADKAARGKDSVSVGPLFRQIRLSTDVMPTIPAVLSQKGRWLEAVFDEDPAAMAVILVVVTGTIARAFLSLDFTFIAFVGTLALGTAAYARLLSGNIRSMSRWLAAVSLLAVPGAFFILIVGFSTVGITYLSLVTGLAIAGRFTGARVRVGRFNHMTWGMFFLYPVIVGIAYTGAVYYGAVKGYVKRLRNPRNYAAPGAGSGGALTMPLWSWLLSRPRISSFFSPDLRWAGEATRQAWAERTVSRLWFRSGVVPFIEFVGMPGITLALGPVVGVGWAVALGALLFTVLHGIPSGRAAASPFLRQGWTTFLVRLGVSFLLLSAAFQPDLLIQLLNVAGLPMPGGISTALLSHPLAFVIGGHALWNAVAPPALRLLVAAPVALPVARDSAMGNPRRPAAAASPVARGVNRVRAWLRSAVRGVTTSSDVYVTRREAKERYIRDVHFRRHSIGANDAEFRETYADVRAIVDKLLIAQGLSPADFRFFLLDEKDVNAFVIRDHDTIFMNLGLIKRALREGMPIDAVAFVLAHEITHIKQGHDDIDAGRTAPETAGEFVREEARNYADEYDADLRSLELMDRAGISVRHAPSLFRALLSERYSSHMGWTHPAMEDRVRRLDAAIREPFYSNYAAAETPFSDRVRSELATRSRHRQVQERTRDPLITHEALIAAIEAAQTREELIGVMVRGTRQWATTRTDANIRLVAAAFERRQADVFPATPAGRAVATAIRSTLYRSLREASFRGFTTEERSEELKTVGWRPEREFISRTRRAEVEGLLTGLSNEDLFDLISLEVPGVDALDPEFYSVVDTENEEAYRAFNHALFGNRSIRQTSPSFMAILTGATGPQETEVDVSLGVYESLMDAVVERVLTPGMSFESLLLLAQRLGDRQEELTLRKGLGERSRPIRDLQSRVAEEVARRIGEVPSGQLAGSAKDLLDVIEQVRSGSFEMGLDLSAVTAAIFEAARTNTAVRDELRERLLANRLGFEYQSRLGDLESAATSAGGVLILPGSLVDQVAQARALFGEVNGGSLVEPLTDAFVAREGPRSYIEPLTDMVHAAPTSGSGDTFWLTERADNALWRMLRMDASDETTAEVARAMIDIQGRTGLAGLGGLSEEMQRLIYFHEIGGVLGTTDLTRQIGYMSAADVEVALLARYLRSLSDRPRQQRMRDTRAFAAFSWDEHLVQIGLYAFRRALGLDAALTERSVDVANLAAQDAFPGERVGSAGTENDIEFERGDDPTMRTYGGGYYGQFVSRARTAKPYSVNRMNMTGATPAELLAEFDWMFAGQRDARAALDRVLAFLPPSPFRNMAIYVWFHRALAARGVRVPPGEWFDQAAVARRVAALYDDPARADDARAIRVAVRLALPHLVADTRVETFNRKLIAGSIAIDADVVPANHDAVSKTYPDIRSYTPGGAGTQVDLLLASLIDSDVQAGLATGPFEQRLARLTAAYRRASSARDRYLDQLAVGATSTQVLQLLPLYSEPASRERAGLSGLELARTEPATASAFATMSGEIEQALRFLPQQSPLRDDVLRQVVDEKAKKPDDVERAETLMLRHNDNIREDASAQTAVAEDVFREAVRNASAGNKRLFLLWLFSFGEKPDFMKALEAKHALRFDGLRDSYARRTGEHYRDAGRRVREDFIRSLLYGETGLLTDDVERRAFMTQLFDAMLPAGRAANPALRSLLRKSFTTAFEKSGQYEREDTLLDLLDNLAAPGQGQRPVLGEAVAVRIFLQSLGLVGVKLGQFIASSGLASAELKEELENLKDRARPIYKGVVFGMIRKVFGSFDSKFSEILELLGSASIKVVYRVTLSDGSVAVLKVKRPDAEKKIDADMAFLRELFADLKDDFAAAGISVPDNIVDIIERGVRRELNFDAEKVNQDLISANMASRRLGLVARLVTWASGRGRTDIGIADPNATEVFANGLMIEAFVEGQSLKTMMSVGDPAVMRKINLDLALELFRQIFIDGVYHADLHNGNIIITTAGEVYLIDLGAVERISPENRQLLMNLFKAMSRKDASAVTDLVRREMPRTSRIVSAQARTISALVASDRNPVEKIFELWSVLIRNGAPVDDELLAVNVALGKAAYLFEGARRRDAAALVFGGTSRSARRPFRSMFLSAVAALALLGFSGAASAQTPLVAAPAGTSVAPEGPADAARMARNIVLTLRSATPDEGHRRVISLFTAGTSPSLRLGQTIQGEAPMSAFDPKAIAAAVSVELSGAVRRGEMTAARANAAAEFLASMFATAQGGVASALIDESAIPEASDGKSPLDVFRWLSPNAATLVSEAEAAAARWRSQRRGVNDRLVLMVAPGQAGPVKERLSALPGGMMGIRVLESGQFGNVTSLLEEVGGLDPAAIATRRLRFIVRNDSGLPPGFFDLASAGLPAGSAEALQRTLEIYLIVSEIAQAVRIDGSQLPSFEAMRLVMIQA